METAARHLALVAGDVASLAAGLVRRTAGAAETSRTKTSPTDVVTHTDLESETLIRRELRARCPGSTIDGEEYDEAVGTNRVGWIVDPIDGTINFLYDLPVVAISIAATMSGDVVAGAVADVHRGDLYTAYRGGGAQRNGHTIEASRCDRLDQSLIGTGFSYASELRAEQADVVAELLPACRDIRCMGSAALNLCWVASGRLDGYYERDLKVYDHAAGALIAGEAGAVVTPPSGSDPIVAAAPLIDQELRRLVDPAAR